MKSPDYKGLTGSAESIQIHLICRRQVLAALLPNSEPTQSLVLSYAVAHSTDVPHPGGRSDEFSRDSGDKAFRTFVWPVLADLG